MPARSTLNTKKFARDRIKLVDLDQRPELISATLATFGACPPGKHHLICGLPASMGEVPTAADLISCLGVVLAVSHSELHGAVALCPYSDEQATLWGPASSAGFHGTSVPERLLGEVKRALLESGFTSLRTLVDTRNRELRAFLTTHGFTAWKDNLVFERHLRKDLPPVTEVRLTLRGDYRAATALIEQAFPETGHLTPDLATREQEGYRHYMLTSPTGLLGVAAVVGDNRRSWLKLIAIDASQRGKGHGHRFIAGILAAESTRGAEKIGLEVLADNAAAVALYTGTGFKKAFTATIMTAPL